MNFKSAINKPQHKLLYINKIDNSQIIFSIMFAKNLQFSAMFAACNNTSTIQDTKRVTQEPTQTSDMTWTHHEPSSNIKARWASQACCEGGNGLKTHFHRLRDAFACHYTEIAAWPNQKWFFKKCFFFHPAWSEVWPPAAAAGTAAKHTAVLCMV